jgi:hypothetical protein
MLAERFVALSFLTQEWRYARCLETPVAAAESTGLLKLDEDA